jgi:hypothetical protein
MVSFAQRFGMDMGYAYTVNTLKVLPEYDLRIAHTISDLKQLPFPNISVRPYVSLYKRIKVYFGADLMKYKVEHSIWFSDKPIYNYRRRLITSEIQIPVMLRYEMFRFKDKYLFSMYAGMYIRFPVWTKGNIWDEGVGIGSESGPYYNVEMYIYEKKQRYNNFVAGFHQTIPLKKYVCLYIDLQGKYQPGLYWLPGSGVARFESMYVSNKFAVGLSAGISFFKPDKEKTANSNPARLQD